MRIGGFQKLTLADFPGKVAAIIFVQGCNFRCDYCHNSELVLPQLFQKPLAVQMILDHLNVRRGKLEGVVITGGEPTLQKGLVDLILQIKEMGFAVKLDTNGSHPEVLTSLTKQNLLDYIAMDIKSALQKYSQAAGIDCDTAKIKESIAIIINSGVPYQFRTTLYKEFCSQEDLRDIQLMIGNADHYVLQPFVRSEKMVSLRSGLQDQYTNLEVELLKAQYDRPQV